MSLRSPLCYCLPDETARVARAAFPRGNPYLLMYDALGPPVEPRNQRAHGVIARVRSHEHVVPTGSAAQTIARHREADGALLGTAVDRYSPFAALAVLPGSSDRGQLRAQERPERQNIAPDGRTG